MRTTEYFIMKNHRNTWWPMKVSPRSSGDKRGEFTEHEDKFLWRVLETSLPTWALRWVPEGRPDFETSCWLRAEYPEHHWSSPPWTQTHGCMPPWLPSAWSHRQQLSGPECVLGKVLIWLYGKGAGVQRVATSWQPKEIPSTACCLPLSSVRMRSQLSKHSPQGWQ